LNEKSQRGSPSDDTDRKEYIELAIICIFINKKVIGDEKSIGKRKTGMSYPEWHRRVKKEYRVVPSNSGWLSNRCKRKDIKKATGLSDYSPVRDKRTEIDFSGFLAFNTCAVGLQIASGWKRRRWQIYVVQFVTWCQKEERRRWKRRRKTTIKTRRCFVDCHSNRLSNYSPAPFQTCSAYDRRRNARSHECITVATLLSLILSRILICRITRIAHRFQRFQDQSCRRKATF